MQAGFPYGWPVSPTSGPRWAVAAALLFMALAGCTQTPSAVPEATASVPPTPESPAATSPETPSPTPSASPVPRSDLTGKPLAAPRPVLVVKYDNTRNAQPHAGLDRADIVYLEEVEYGITRIAAVFSSDVPTRIGPVRSARITDIDLLAQFGSPAFSFSGVQRKMWPAIDASPLIDVSPNKSADSYARDRSRRAPYNYFLDGNAVLQKASDASLSQDIGFRFDSEVPASGAPVRKARVEWSYASADFTYQPGSNTYAVDLNGIPAISEASGLQQQANTVVIQYVKQTPSKYFDKGGGNTPHAETIGSGTALVLRDGLAFEVTWTREAAEDGTHFTRADGSEMTFAPGQTWVVLMDEDRPATVRPKSALNSASSTEQVSTP